MVNPVVLTLTLIFAATVAGSLYDASANRELERKKKLVEITHDQILEEKCPDPDVKVAKRNVLQTTDDGVHLEMMSKLFQGSKVGVIMPIDLYGADSGGNCQYAVDRGSVMRCSDKPHDYVYRYDGNDKRYALGFCGMTA